MKPLEPVLVVQEFQLRHLTSPRLQPTHCGWGRQWQEEEECVHVCVCVGGCCRNFPDHRDTAEASVISSDPSPPPGCSASKNRLGLFQSILHSEARATKRRIETPKFDICHHSKSVSSGLSLICSRGRFEDLC